MKKKSVKGLPSVIGFIGVILMFVAFIMTFSYNTMATSVVGAFDSTISMVGYIVVIGKFLIYPGIYGLILLISTKKNINTKAFAVIWMVVAIIGVIICMTAITGYSGNSFSSMLTETFVPDYVKTANIIELIANGLVIVSNVIILVNSNKVSE